MEVILNKNIKYKGLYYKKGDLIEIKDQNLEEFIKKEIITLDSSEVDLLNLIIEDDKEVLNTIGIDDDKVDSKDDLKPYEISDFSKDEIIEILVENNIKHNKNDKKDILFNLLP